MTLHNINQQKRIINSYQNNLQTKNNLIYKIKNYKKGNYNKRKNLMLSLKIRTFKLKRTSVKMI